MRGVINMKTITPVSRIAGEISLPGDKSISHRAAFLGALSKEGIEVSNFSPGADCESTLNCLEKIGCSVTRKGGVVKVSKAGSFVDPDSVLDAGNSGTTARLLCGLVSGQPGLFAVISGDESLSRRPMGRVVRPLQAMGARIDGRKCGEGLPLAVKGTLLAGGKYTPSAASAQIKTALILAGLSSSGSTTVHEPRQTRDHTEMMLSYLKVPVLIEDLSVTVFPCPDLPGGSWAIPGDFSASAFWLVAGSILPGSDILIRASGVNPTRTGALDVLRRMGADITLEYPRTSGGEPVADIHVKASALRGVEIGEEEIPSLVDELPVLAVAATQAEGTTIVRGAAELRVKECDRIRAMAEGLSALGAHVTERPDGWEIQGPVRLKGGKVRSFGDHRIAMALSIAALTAGSAVEIDDPSCVSISYPLFFETLEAVSSGGI